MKVICAEYSDPGSREVNEDTVGFYEKGDDFCAVVADGLGGHGKGDLASQTVVRTVKAFFESNEWSEEFMGKLFVHCNNTLLKEQKNVGDSNGMKTTLVVAVKHGDEMTWCHCGDSRLYLFKGGRLVTRTLDHSVPQMLVFSKEIKEGQIRNHPDRSRLLKCLGIQWEKPLYEVGRTISLSGGQTVLMCTDGFWELILEREMGWINLTAKDAQTKLDRMRKRVSERGIDRSMDNNSAILLSVL